MYSTVWLLEEKLHSKQLKTKESKRTFLFWHESQYSLTVWVKNVHGRWFSGSTKGDAEAKVSRWSLIEDHDRWLRERMRGWEDDKGGLTAGVWSCSYQVTLKNMMKEELEEWGAERWVCVSYCCRRGWWSTGQCWGCCSAPQDRWPSWCPPPSAPSLTHSWEERGR